MHDKTSALIGHTGFVGSNLLRQYRFTHCYHSSTIEDLRGRDMSLVVCAGVQAVKWWANKHPEQDLAGIQRLLDVLREVRADTFVLISTVDVYPHPVGVDETETPEAESLHAYGRHRLHVERFVREHFAHACIVRLPGLFGEGLKKNVLYDLLHDNNLDAVHPGAAYQYYFLGRLWADLQTALDEEIRLLNLATEPLETGVVLTRFFPDKRVGGAGPAPRYDVRSRYTGVWGRQDGYLYGAEDVLRDLGTFIRRQQGDEA